MAGDEIKSSRVRRAASITGAAARVATRTATAKAMSGSGTSERRREAAAKQQLKAARSLVKIFSGMRGAAMKVGQTLSAVDLGLVPEEVRPEFQEILATLQQGAEPVSFKAIEKVVRGDLGGSLADHFSDFQEEPIAAASIGQVHRAITRDGRDVAVKVQYPGIAEAIQSDLGNLRLGLKLLNVVAPGIDTAAIAEEVRERIIEELDYELEAQNQRRVARAYHGHPFATVPAIVSDLCRERVLVMDFVEGERLPAMRERDQAERNRIGEILVRFYICGPLRHRLLNGDPHPGNALVRPDGSIAFIDFGFFKHLSRAEVDNLIASNRAVHQRDPLALLQQMVTLGALPDDPAIADLFFEAYESIFGWIFTEEPLRVDGTRTGEMMRRYNQMRTADGFESLELPAQHLVMMRSVMLLIGILGQLEAENRWFAITREWLYGDEPETDLGRAEAEYLRDRGTT